MGAQWLDDYVSETEDTDLSLEDFLPEETFSIDGTESKPERRLKSRRAVEYYFDRKQLRDDLTFFS
ncbi:MAG: PA3496 family putative envelope integrity protein [Gammaproteobacteria bacterium]